MEGPNTPKNIGKYIIMGVLGRGSMGVVYKAKDPEIGRIVAIKVLRHPAGLRTLTAEAALERFRAEARSAGNLRHPNIITVFDVNTDDGNPYIVMDYIEGESLSRRLYRLEKLSPRDAMHFLGQIGAGLDYAHTRSVIHRDVKPSNILIDASQRVFILDFGVAHAGDAGVENEPVMGTPSYMSPEQILNKDLDYRTDLFSLAVMAFECLTGKRPFAGNDTTTVLSNILKGIRCDLTEAAPELPLALEAAFDQALAFEKHERFLSSAEMLQAFRKALALPGLGVELVQSDFSPASSTLEEYSSSNSEAVSSQISEIQKWPASPGDALFGGTWYKTPTAFKTPESNSASESLDSKVLAEKRSIKERLGTWQSFLILSSIFFIILGGLMIWSSLHHSPRNVPIPLISAEGILLHNFSGEDYFGALQTTHAPQGKKIEELNEGELLGVLMDKTSAEERILAALHEGCRRNCKNLVEAACFLLEHDSYLIRLQALDVLDRLRNHKATGRIVHLLEDYDPAIRKKTAEVLGRLGDRRALGHLKAQLIKENLGDVINEIKNAINILGKVPADIETKN